MRTAIKNNNPVIFAEPALLYGMKGEVPDRYYEIPLGSASVVDEGNDVTLVSYGAGMSLLSDASKTLSDNNIDAEIIDLRS